MLVQELYVESNPPPSSSYGGFNNVPPPAPLPAHPPSYANAPPPSYEPPTTPNDNNPPMHLVQVPFPTLVNFGVQTETVRQLTEMKGYLWRHVSVHLPHKYLSLFILTPLFVSLVWIGFIYFQRSCSPTDYPTTTTHAFGTIQ